MPSSFIPRRSGVLVISVKDGGVEVRRYSTRDVIYMGEHLNIEAMPIGSDNPLDQAFELIPIEKNRFEFNPLRDTSEEAQE